MPWPSCRTVSLLRLCIAARVDPHITHDNAVLGEVLLGLGVQRWLDSSRALLGMHPTRKQVPPSCDSFSTQATRKPSCAARMAPV